MTNKTQLPKTPKRIVTDEFFGIKVEDPYRWLEENKTEEVQKWLKAQAEFANAYLNNLMHKEELKVRLTEIFSYDTIGIPSLKKGRYFFNERKGDEDMSIFYVKESLEGEARVLIDPNTLSEDKSIILQGTSITEDGKLVAYYLSKAGNDKQSVHILDVDTGRTLEDYIPDDLYPDSVKWLNDKSGFYYTRRPENVPLSEEKYHKKIYLHKLGTNYLGDELVIDPMEINPNLQMLDSPWVTFSKDQRYMISGTYIGSEAKHRTELYFFDNENPQKGFVPIVKDIPESIFYAFIYKDKIYVHTNHDAPNWESYVVDVDKIENGMDAWNAMIPEHDSVLENIWIVKDRFFCIFLENVQSILKEYDLEGNFVRQIKLPDTISIESVTYEEDGDEMFIGYDSFVLPFTISRMDLTDNSITLFKQMEAGFDVNSLKTEQIWYESKDGTSIPMFVIHEKGLELNGNNPTLLYGYGGFNISLTPSFMKSMVPLLEKGGVVAIANLRGGGEFGEKWHEAGMRNNKQNVFDDFISAAEWLIGSKYTSSSKLAIMGGSNGGLLVNTVANQRPDLMKVVISQVPVTDMTRYQEFDGGRWWIADYGSVEEEGMVEYLLSYSPYHNVVDGEEYPAILIATSDEDDRVHPMHSYKITARLQEANASDNPILLRVELKSGHGGASAVSKFVESNSDIWAFVFEQLGIE